ncbi:MAG: MFS transporter [Patescibacteria group bacterium]|nr:MFS transporter [Patescibacteria group bacterium]
MKNNKIIQVLAVRPFFYLLISEIFSQLAINMLNFVLVIVAFTVAHSNTAVSGVVFSFMLPSLLFGILAGVIVDKRNKKNVLFMTNVLRGILVFPLAFLHTNIFIIYILTFFVAFITQFFIPAETPIIPLLVRKDQLLSANALFGMGIYGSIFLAYALSGPVLIIFGRTNVFIVFGLLFLIGAFFASLIKVKEPKANKVSAKDVIENISLTKEIKIAVSIMAKTKAIYRALFLLTLAQVIILVLAVVGPGYAQRVLRIRVEDFPFLFVTPAIIGMALSAICIGSFFHKVSKEKLTRIGLVLLGFSILLLPYGSKVESREIVQAINFYLPHFLKINILHIMIVLAFIMGVANALVLVPANTVLQEETSDEFRGKVYGALSTLVGLFSLLPIILVGSLADLIGVKGVLTGIGVIVLAIAAFRIVFYREK